jgi:NADH:ubiquinone oxidoreductase subunit 6 (subunit J)
MLNLRILEVYSSLVNIFPIASFLGLFLFFELLYIVSKEFFIINYIYNNYLELNMINNYLIYSNNNLYLIGDLLFNHYNIMLIVVGLILLLAMLGAIILTKDFNNKVIEKKNLTKSSITF